MRRYFMRLLGLKFSGDNNMGGKGSMDTSSVGNYGDRNEGNYNVGEINKGDNNLGDRNQGSKNIGDENTGNNNVFSLNVGNNNTGHQNRGSYNKGAYNYGDSNSGSYNTGIGNAGGNNSGNRNCGRYNSGNSNCGSYNSGDGNSGILNSGSPKIMIFDKPTDMTLKQWEESIFYEALNSVSFVMTEFDRGNPTSGKLNVYTYFEACAKWWYKLNGDNKNVIQKLPNFNKDKFYRLTGIRL
jgi:hypothetical protein